jgi:hypothetical protein
MRKNGLLVFVFAGWWSSSCGGGDSGRTLDSYVERLHECGMISEGIVNFPAWLPSPAVACYTECMAVAECADLVAFVCDGDAECSACHFVCDDGEAINMWYQCDGEEDCADGSDEIDCDMFACGDGDVVPPSGECDGYADCENGADEHSGCPTFTCDDGEIILAALQCDFEVDCEDASDEAGCAQMLVECP